MAQFSQDTVIAVFYRPANQKTASNHSTNIYQIGGCCPVQLH